MMKKRKSSSQVNNQLVVANKKPLPPLTREEVLKAVQISVASIRSCIRREIATIVFVEGFENYSSSLVNGNGRITCQMYHDLLREFEDFTFINPELMKREERAFQKKDPFPVHTLATHTFKNFKNKYYRECHNIRFTNEIRIKHRIKAILILKKASKILDIYLPLEIIKEIVRYCA